MSLAKLAQAGKTPRDPSPVRPSFRPHSGSLSVDFEQRCHKLPSSLALNGSSSPPCLQHLYLFFFGLFYFLHNLDYRSVIAQQERRFSPELMFLMDRDRKPALQAPQIVCSIRGM